MSKKAQILTNNENKLQMWHRRASKATTIITARIWKINENHIDLKTHPKTSVQHNLQSPLLLLSLFSVQPDYKNTTLVIVCANNRTGYHFCLVDIPTIHELISHIVASKRRETNVYIKFIPFWKCQRKSD